ncbi:YkuJ family protein [Limosilactobacillus sp. STM2_1]|uniref:YkuJ family protein n=1 Tax=Limosilactobacillus rudii TaxID=2759755 RepID=A0A7W3UMZ4_9LACO|nr:YkuJ family protein [Limosilactobacillus rudii]MBB1079817.1 YkuJ family protein [Limosilactobacillus rudii]MBB1097895.1 YkuJ family protein [Limosilactobacillus rudii]MCD7134977.1 YkuJ family protein [Limosilactobacillus rudii]
MKESELLVIIKRLNAMQNDYSKNRQKRTFEKFGIPLCDVTYLHDSQEFIFVRYRPYERFRFDDIDLVAIEVFDCLYDLENTF